MQHTAHPYLLLPHHIVIIISKLHLSLRPAFCSFRQEPTSNIQSQCQHNKKEPHQMAICESPLDTRREDAGGEYGRECTYAAIDGERQSVHRPEHGGGRRNVVDAKLDGGYHSY